MTEGRGDFQRHRASEFAYVRGLLRPSAEEPGLGTGAREMGSGRPSVTPLFS
jgi:hypothetical protein